MRASIKTMPKDEEQRLAVMLFAPGNDERKAVAERIRAIEGVREVQVNSYFGLRVMTFPHAIRPITEEDEVRSVVVLGEIRPFMNMAKVG